jgi:hypothetical protein
VRCIVLDRFDGQRDADLRPVRLRRLCLIRRCSQVSGSAKANPAASGTYGRSGTAFAWSSAVVARTAAGDAATWPAGLSMPAWLKVDGIGRIRH